MTTIQAGFKASSLTSSLTRLASATPSASTVPNGGCQTVTSANQYSMSILGSPLILPTQTAGPSESKSSEDTQNTSVAGANATPKP